MQDDPRQADLDPALPEPQPAAPAEEAPRETREIELKLEAPADGWAALDKALRKTPGVVKRRTPQRLATAYFDTPDLSLDAAQVALRIRRKGRVRIQTLKVGGAGAGLFDRAEFERPVRSDTPKLNEEERAALALALGREAPADQALFPIFTTHVKRALYDAARADWAIEIAADDATVESGLRQAAFRELELELKAGEPAALFALAREICAAAPLRVSVRAKSTRGYALARGEAPRSYKGVISPILPGMDVEGAFRATAFGCLAQFRLNEELILSDPRPSPVHRARVALRRLRSAFPLFRGVVADARMEALKLELKWLAGSLGDARELDVFVKDQFASGGAPEDAVPARGLAKMVEGRRAAAYARALEALNSPRALALPLDLVEWLETGDWRRDPAGAEARAQPVEAFAAAALDKALRRLRKRGKDLADLSVEARHEARISAKKLRYACEFFAPLYDGKAARRRDEFLALMTTLQDELGALNDVAATGALTRNLADEAGEKRDGGSAFAAGLIAGAAQARAADAPGKAEKRLKKLLDARPFWS